MKKNSILLVVSLAMFMESVDTTVINTAIPLMAQSLNVNPVNLKLALISYLLSLAIFIPISGWMADKFGTKRVFITAVFIFTLSSIWCGLTTSLPELILARVLQGIGGSFTLPLGRLIIVRIYQRHELIAKTNVVVMVAAIGMMLGPWLGGLITELFSWRWIFFVNVPVGLLAIILGLKLLPPMPPEPVHSLDKLGFILFGSGLATLTFGFSILSESDIASLWSIITILSAAALLFLYAKHSQGQTHPIIKTDLLHIRTFKVSVLGNLLARFGFGGIPFLIPLFLQLTLGFSPQLSGLLLVPIALGIMVMKPFTLPILRFVGYKKLLICNTILISLSLLSFAAIGKTTSNETIAILTLIYGMLLTMQYTGMNSLAYADMQNRDISAASSIMSTVQQIAQSFGVAVAAIILSFFALVDGDWTLTITTFHKTFVGLAILTMLSLVIFIRLKAEDGEGLIQRPLMGG